MSPTLNLRHALSHIALAAALATAGWLPASQAAETTPYQVGQWLPSDQQRLEDWVAEMVAGTNSAQLLQPAAQELADLIHTDPVLYMPLQPMFDQLPDQAQFQPDPTGTPQIPNVEQMLQVLTTAAHHSTMQDASIHVH